MSVHAIKGIENTPGPMLGKLDEVLATELFDIESFSQKKEEFKNRIQNP